MTTYEVIREGMEPFTTNNPQDIKRGDLFRDLNEKREKLIGKKYLRAVADVGADGLVLCKVRAEP